MGLLKTGPTIAEEGDGRMPTLAIDPLPRLSVRQMLNDPYGVLATYRNMGRAVPVDMSGVRMWLVTHYDDVRGMLVGNALSRDLQKYRDTVLDRTLRPGLTARVPSRSRLSFFTRDGEDHHRMRGLVAKMFSPAAVSAQTTRVDALVGELLDALPRGEPVDIIAGLARPLALTILSDMYGIPESERGQLPEWETTMVSGTDIAAIEAAAFSLHTFSQRMVEQKKAAPGGDVFSYLLTMHTDGQLTQDELASTYLLLVVAGLEPASAIGNGIHTLLAHPDQLRELIHEPSLFGNAVEEILRFEPPFRFLPQRLTIKPVQLGDVTIPAGEFVLLSLAAAGRDPSRFDDPDTFDVKRDCSGHLSFGHGRHRCIGSALGRLQLETALRRLFLRFPEARLAFPEREVGWRPGKFMRRLEQLFVIL